MDSNERHALSMTHKRSVTDFLKIDTVRHHSTCIPTRCLRHLPCERTRPDRSRAQCTCFVFEQGGETDGDGTRNAVSICSRHGTVNLCVAWIHALACLRGRWCARSATPWSCYARLRARTCSTSRSSTTYACIVVLCRTCARMRICMRRSTPHAAACHGKLRCGDGVMANVQYKLAQRGLLCVHPQRPPRPSAVHGVCGCTCADVLQFAGA